MIVVVAGALALAFFVLLGRGARSDPRPLLWTLASVGSAGAAVFVGLRGGWMFSIALVLLSLFLSRRARLPSFRPRTGYAPRTPSAAPPSGMSVADARDILGVPPTATRAEVEAAYRRLMQRAHPDHGGSAGLAARINAARDRLLNGR